MTPTSTLGDMSSIQSTSSHASRVFTNLPRLMITSTIESNKSRAFSFQDDNLNCKPPLTLQLTLSLTFLTQAHQRTNAKIKRKPSQSKIKIKTCRSKFRPKQPNRQPRLKSLAASKSWTKNLPPNNP
jgi:hypothetical protein